MIFTIIGDTGHTADKIRPTDSVNDSSQKFVPEELIRTVEDNSYAIVVLFAISLGGDTEEARDGVLGVMPSKKY